MTDPKASTAKHASYFDRKPTRIEPTVSAGRVPPHDLDAEAAVLSACMLDREALLVALYILKPENFYSDANGRIFEAMYWLHKDGKPVDAVSIASWLRDRERLAQVGGSGYIAQLCDATPAVAHVDAHAAVVHEKWRLRHLIAVCQKIAAEGYGDIGDAQEFISGAHQAIGQLAQLSYENRRGVTAREGITRIFNNWQNPQPDDRLCTSIPDLDRVIRKIRRKQLIVIGAHSGIGKSALAACMMSFNARAKLPNGKKIGGIAFIAEMSVDEYLERMIFGLARVDAYKIDEDNRHLITPEEWQRISIAAAELAVSHLRIIDDCDDMTVALAEARKAKREFEEMGIELRYICWDYAQIMKPGAEAGKRIDNREQEVSAVGRLAKKTCQELDVSGFLLAQLNEDSRKEGRKPSARDMRESKGLLQDANVVLLVYNPHAEERSNAYYTGEEVADEGGEEVDIIVGKIRGGRGYTVKATYFPSFTLFAPWDPNATDVRRMRADQDPKHQKRGRK
jgi:replicative DNA helicase